ncbi:MAG TPA: hypothetical protein DGX96_05880 [Lachnospiraceae bacterium]|jgi:hypothetical protein|nr:hypothetical protein [Lachnospiraceae bacterium]
MRFQELIDRLAEKVPVEALNIQQNNEISRVMIEDGADSELCTVHNTIVIVPRGQNMTGNAGGAVFIGKGEGILPPDAAQVSAGIPAERIALILQDLLLSENGKKVFENEILTLLVREESLDTVLTRLAERYQCAAVILDLSGRVLHHSSPFPEGVAYLSEYMERGICPPAYMEHLHRVEARKKRLCDREPFTSFCDEAGIWYLCANVLVHGELSGYCFLTRAENDFPEESGKLLTLVAGVVGNRMEQIYGAMPTNRQRWSHLIEDALTGLSGQQIRERAASFPESLPDRMQVIVLVRRMQDGRSENPEIVRGAAASAFPDDPMAVYDHHLVLLLPADVEQDDARAQSLRDLCGRQGLVCGVSFPFSDAARIRQHYDEALRAVRLSRKLYEADCLSTAHAMMIYEVLDRLPEGTDFDALCHPALRMLKDYDASHGTDLYNTLITLALNNYSMAKTCQDLFIHRNTMMYRKRRIEVLTGIPLDDPQLRFEIQFSLAVRNYRAGQD